EEVRNQLAKHAAPVNDEMLSTADAAQVAKVVPATIRRWIAAGKLRGFSAGRELRISRADLERLMKTDRAWTDSMTPEQRARRDHG
ncbi:MAG TPA: helix-turn-helix domain-containing protein, partial [Kofleriaceae bacterium]